MRQMYDKDRVGVINTYRESVARRLVERFQELLIIEEREGKRLRQATVAIAEEERMRRDLEFRRRESRIMAMREELLQNERTLRYLSDSISSSFNGVSATILWVMAHWGVKAIPEILEAAQRLRRFAENKDSATEDRKRDLDLYYMCLERVGKIDGSIQYLFTMFHPSLYPKEATEALALRGSAVIPYFCFLWHLKQEDSNSEPRIDLEFVFGEVLRRSIHLKTDVRRDSQRIVCEYRRTIIAILGERLFMELVEMLDPMARALIQRKLSHDSKFS